MLDEEGFTLLKDCFSDAKSSLEEASFPCSSVRAEKCSSIACSNDTLVSIFGAGLVKATAQKFPKKKGGHKLKATLHFDKGSGNTLADCS